MAVKVIAGEIDIFAYRSDNTEPPLTIELNQKIIEL